MSKILVKTVKEYMRNSSFHGLRFIAQDGVHWTERVFWVATVTMSWYYASTLTESSWRGYQNNAISFVADTTYKDWNTAFPSVTICEAKNSERTEPIARDYWKTIDPNTTHDVNLEEVIQQLSFFNGESYFVKEYCFVKTDKGFEYDAQMKCPLGNFFEIAKDLRSSCGEVFKQCTWRDKEFDCCKYFLPLDTEFGVCYALNNAHVNASYHPERHIMDTMSNFSTGPGTLSLLLQNNTYKGFFHPREDVPTLSIAKPLTELLTRRYPRRIWFKVLEVKNDPEVKETSVQQRKCRFLDENILSSFDSYGYTPCVLECRKREQMDLCGCSVHAMPRSKPHERCGLHGIVCISDYHIHLSVLRNAWNVGGSKKGILCSECLASCTEMELQVTRKNVLAEDKSEILPRFTLSLEALPTERPRRIVVRGILDLVVTSFGMDVKPVVPLVLFETGVGYVPAPGFPPLFYKRVSMGGAAGLLVGASLLSFVELIYFFTLRLYGNFKAEKEAADKNKKTPIGSQKRFPLEATSFPFDDRKKECF